MRPPPVLTPPAIHRLGRRLRDARAAPHGSRSAHPGVRRRAVRIPSRGNRVSCRALAACGCHMCCRCSTCSRPPRRPESTEMSGGQSLIGRPEFPRPARKQRGTTRSKRKICPTVRRQDASSGQRSKSLACVRDTCSRLFRFRWSFAETNSVGLCETGKPARAIARSVSARRTGRTDFRRSPHTWRPLGKRRPTIRNH